MSRESVLNKAVRPPFEYGSMSNKMWMEDEKPFVWYGSINLLSYGASEESVMRIESLEIAAELSAIA